jgi:hypothetical protein
MSQSTTTTTTQSSHSVLHLRGEGPEDTLYQNRNDGPLKYNGSLDKYEVRAHSSEIAPSMSGELICQRCSNTI